MSENPQQRVDETPQSSYSSRALLARLRQWVAQSNRRTVRLINKQGAKLVELNQTVALVLTVLLVFSPFTGLFVLSVIAAYFVGIRVQMLREIDSGEVVDLTDTDKR